MGLFHGDDSWSWSITANDVNFKAPPGSALLVKPTGQGLARVATRCKEGDVVGSGYVVVSFRPGIWTRGQYEHVFDPKSAALPHYLNGEALDMALEVWGFCAWARGEADAGTVAWDVNEKGEAVNIRFFDHVKRAGLSKCEPAGAIRCAC